MHGEWDLVSLIQGVKEGDEGALQEIIRRYGRFLQVYIRRRLKRDATDVNQELWIRFVEKVQQGQIQVETTGQFVSLMKTMAGHMAIDSSRKAMRARRCVAGDAVFADIAARAETPSRLFAQRASIAEAYEAMSPIQWDMVQMKAEGYRNREIAEQLNLSSEGAVAVAICRLQRAMQKRRAMQERNEDR